MPRWTREETVDYLESGFRKAGVTYRLEELEEVYHELAGIPGFISFYGLHRVRGATHEKALEKAIEYATKQHIYDLRAFLQIYNSPLYVIVLHLLAESPTGMTWSELQTGLERLRNKSTSKSTLYRILLNLQKAGLVHKRLGKYLVTDITLKRAITSISNSITTIGL